MKREAFTTIIPAQPEWAVLYPELYQDGDRDFKFTDLDPIIAWGIETYPLDGEDGYCSFTYPVTIGNLRHDKWMLVEPDGSISHAGSLGIGFLSIREAIDFIRKAYSERG